MNSMGRAAGARAQIIDGKSFAMRVDADVALGVQALQASHGIVPGLAVVLVGQDPASEVYVRNKGRLSLIHI